MSGLLPNRLFAGPRGRRLLLEIACVRNPQLEELMYANLVSRLDSNGESRVIVELARATALLEQYPPTEYELLGALQETVSRAMYWQAPDPEDQLFAQPRMASALKTVAEVVAQHAPRWWTEPLANEQFRVQAIPGPSMEQHEAWQAGAGVRKWYAQTVQDEIAAQSNIPDPSANYTGSWWSTPAHFSVPTTTRMLGDLGPVGLWAQEDSAASKHAVAYPVMLIGASRILEINSAHDYARLVEAFPLRVTWSRYHDWYRASGSVDEWFIPHWGLIAKEYEGVHLTTAAYLEGATKRIPVSGGSTMIAGWSPDVTIWTGNCAVLGGAPTEWTQAQDGSREFWLAA